MSLCLKTRHSEKYKEQVSHFAGKQDIRQRNIKKRLVTLQMKTEQSKKNEKQVIHFVRKNVTMRKRKIKSRIVTLKGNRTNKKRDQLLQLILVQCSNYVLQFWSVSVNILPRMMVTQLANLICFRSLDGGYWSHMKFAY